MIFLYVERDSLRHFNIDLQRKTAGNPKGNRPREYIRKRARARAATQHAEGMPNIMRTTGVTDYNVFINNC